MNGVGRLLESADAHPARGTRALAIVLAVVMATPGWMWAAVSNRPELPDPGHASMTREQQIRLGQQAMQQVYKQMPILPDSSPVTQYVQSLGRKLQAQIPPQYNWPYQFHVLQQKEINAFALPGGPIFINLGTINAASNEAQLAGVMAHEMSHVYMMHTAKSAGKEEMAQGIGAVLGAVLGGVVGGAAGGLIQMGGQLTGGLLSMKYSRHDEAQADAVGAIIMYKAGYNPVELARFFQKLETQGGAPPQFLSDHPNPGNRVQAVQDEVRNWPPQTYLTESVQFQQVKQQASQIRAYTAQQISQMAKSGEIHNSGPGSGPEGRDRDRGPDQGPPPDQGPGQGQVIRASASDVEPSGNWQQYNQNGMRMQYPSNWQVFGGQQGQGLTIAPASGVSQEAVAYGVVVNGFTPNNANGLDQSVQQLIQATQQGNPDLKVIGNTDIRVNGVPAKSVDMQGTSPVQDSSGRPQMERDWMVALPSSGNQLTYLIFIAPDKDFSHLRPTFEQMLKTFRMQ